ncbi:MAG: hypothetical protein ACHQHO_06160 [Solirubrobacterales bacterium]
MHREELIRASVAVPVSVLLPLCAPLLRRAVIRTTVAAVIVIAAEAPYLGDSRIWLALAVATVVTLASGACDPRKPAWSLVLSAAATLAAALLIDARLVQSATEQVAEDRNVVIVVAGWLAAAFISGAFIGRVLESFARAVRNHAPGMTNAGRYIGWLERTLLYGLFVAGAPDAAALVIAGKSIARFPSFKEEQFAEYYLIGSFLSLTVAAGAGMAVRAAMGLHPLVPIRI